MLATSRTDIRQQLRSYFAEQLPGWQNDVSDSEPLELYGLDSTGIAILVLYLEESFNIQILDEDLTEKNLGTIQRIMDYVQRQTASV